MFVLRTFRPLALLLALLAAGPVSAQEAEGTAARPEPRLMRIGTNTVSGLYFPTGGALCRMAGRLREAGMRCLVDATNGSTSNIRGLRARDLEFGIVQSDWLYHAYNGTGLFRKGGALKDLRAVMALYSESFTVLVRRDSDIASFDQLRGRRIGAGPPGSGQRILFDILAAAHGWRRADVAGLRDPAGAELGRAFCAQELDAVVMLTSHPNTLVRELVETCGARLLPMAGETVDRVLRDRPYYARAAIGGSLYQGQPEVGTIGVRAVLVTTKDVPGDMVYGLVRSVFEHFDEFTGQLPNLAGLRREEMVRAGLTAPLQDSAARFYREAGLLR